MADNPLSIIQELGQVPGLLKEIYGDLAKPGVSQVGKAVGSLLGLGNTLLWPITLLNERARICLEKNLEKYRLQLENIAEDKVVEVPPELGVPILEKLGYVSDEELGELFVNLLARASVTETVQLAHPGFIAIISSLTPDEAVLLKAMRRLANIPFTAGIPFVTAVQVKKNENE